MKKKLLHISLIAITSIVLAGCSIMQAVALIDCNYSYGSVSDFSFMGLKGKEMASISGLATIGKALLGKTETAPLGMVVNLVVENPNKQTAAIERIYYKVHLDTVLIADGNTASEFIVAGGTSATLPLPINVDLKTALKGSSRTALVKALKNMVGINADPTEVTVDIKPVVKVGNGTISTPKYIPIHFTYEGKNEEKNAAARAAEEAAAAEAKAAARVKK